MINRSLIRKIAAVASMVFLAFFASCGKKEMKLTPAQVDEIIQREIPIGSTKEQVVSFIESKGIGSFKVIRDQYRQGQPVGTDAPEENVSAVKGYLAALIKDVGQDPGVSAIYNIRMLFYFGEGERLVGHKVFVAGTH